MQPNQQFNKAWISQNIAKPLIILIGGYAGTGKSTLASSFADMIDHTQVIPTGIFRSIAQAQTVPSENPALFLSTYDLHTMNAQKEEPIFQAYKEQCAPVTVTINSVINFMSTEKQHLIIEGNHILPWEEYKHHGCHTIELYLEVADPEKHRKMLGGPTHKRTINDKQFATGRIIHDILSMEARKHKKAVFEASNIDDAKEYLQQELSVIIRSLAKKEE